MNLRSTRRSWLPVALAAACLWMAGSRHRPLIDMREAHEMTAAAPLENAPPLIVFTTVALGGFRGVIADVLWTRVMELQDDGKYLEIVQLADWITKLEPRFTDVWAFHGWNMAYNISVMFSEPRERWRWIQNGIRLLRDQGLRYNPGDPQLYSELGWIFQHKIGGRTDSAHNAYKSFLAEETSALGLGPDMDYAALAAVPERRRELVLRGLEPEIMASVDRVYGPLDWRLPATHAVYWAFRGRQVAREPSRACDRMIAQSLSDLLERGHLRRLPGSDAWLRAPDLQLLDKVLAAHQSNVDRYPDEGFRSGYFNGLIDAILLLDAFGRSDETDATVARLRRLFPEHAAEMTRADVLMTALASQTRDASRYIVVDRVIGELRGALMWLAVGDRDRSRGYQRLAEMRWRAYVHFHPDAEAEADVAATLSDFRDQALRQVVAAARSPKIIETLKGLAIGGWANGPLESTP